MFRKRLRGRSGCLRCRSRKKKCDETKPTCGFCTQWNVECRWPDPGAKVSRTKGTALVCSTEKETSPDIVEINTIGLGPFHIFPIENVRHRSSVTSLLHSFFGMMGNRPMPFDLRSTGIELTRGWTQSALEDPAVCYAFAAYCARLQSQRSHNAQHTQTAIEFETCALVALRQRLEANAQMTEQTILLACLHFIALAHHNTNVRELRRVYDGICTMINLSGGLAHMWNNMHLGTTQLIEVCSIYCSQLSGTSPLSRQRARPTPPRSWAKLFTKPFRHAKLEERCGTRIMEMMNDMACILFFHNPSSQARALKIDEQMHLFRLFRYVDNQLGCLQIQYEGVGTLSEVVVMAMIVLKRETAPSASQHPNLTPTILGRLRTAIVTSLSILEAHVYTDELYQDVTTWACLTALVGLGSIDRSEFGELFAKVMRLRYSMIHRPPGWQDEVLQRLKLLPWHIRLEKCYTKTCDQYLNIVQTDSHTSNTWQLPLLP